MHCGTKRLYFQGRVLVSRNATDHQGSSAFHSAWSGRARCVLNSRTLGSVGRLSFPVCLSKPNHLFAQSIQRMRLLLRSSDGCSRLSFLAGNSCCRGLGDQRVLESPRSNRCKPPHEWPKSTIIGLLCHSRMNSDIAHSGTIGALMISCWPNSDRK